MTGGGDPDPAGVRMFFAAVPALADLEGFDAAARGLLLAPPARRVAARNHHLTLAFVGGVSAAQVEDLRSIGRGQRAQGFALRFDAYEYWPKPEVIVAAARAIPDALDLLWQRLHRDLAVHGWALDPKRLRPHVTLARKVSQAPVLQAMSPFEWRIRSFSLMRSDTGAAESAYTVVDTWPLLYDAEKL